MTTILALICLLFLFFIFLNARQFCLLLIKNSKIEKNLDFFSSFWYIKTMTKEQIKWASQHDWYQGSHNGSVLALDRVFDAKGLISCVTLAFSSFNELRSWAGY